MTLEVMTLQGEGGDLRVEVATPPDVLRTCDFHLVVQDETRYLGASACEAAIPRLIQAIGDPPQDGVAGGERGVLSLWGHHLLAVAWDEQTGAAVLVWKDSTRTPLTPVATIRLSATQRATWRAQLESLLDQLIRDYLTHPLAEE